MLDKLLPIIPFLPLTALLLGFCYVKDRESRKLRSTVAEKENNLKHQIYEINFMDQLSERIGYSLDVHKIIDVAAGSLEDFISYTSIAYLLVEGKKLIFKIQLNESVSGDYVQEVKRRSTSALKNMLVDDVDQLVVDETVQGRFISEANNLGIASSFNIPISISGKIVGLINISSTHPNLYEEQVVSRMYKVVGKASDTITKLQSLVMQERSKLEAMIQSMNMGVLMIDKEFQILVVNPACYRLLGFKENSDISIFDITEYFSGSLFLEEKIAHVFATGYSDSVDGVKKNDKYYQVVIVPVKNGEDILGAGILISDQTKEQELKRLREDFTAMMVHELRSPLSVIKGTADLIYKEYDNLTREQVSGFLVQVEDSATSLLAIVNNLLDSAKIEAGKIELAKKPTNIDTLLENRCSYYSGLAKLKMIAFTTNFEPCKKMVSIDELRINQVLNNLLSNALKFSTENGEVTVSSKCDGSFITISVADNGSGVPRELVSKLFNKYVQIRQSGTKGEEGTGLGLVISKGIVEAHGGKIWYENNVPRGAKFIFQIPL